MTLDNAEEQEGIMKNVKTYELKRKQLQQKMRTKLASTVKTPSRNGGGSSSKSNFDHRTGLHKINSTMDKDHKYLRINWENDKHVIEGLDAEKQILETFINDCIRKWDRLIEMMEKK